VPEPRVKSKLARQKRKSTAREDRNVYRIMATDSNVLSGYFQHGFQCPTQSSTYQRKKPIAYDLEIAQPGIKRRRRRPLTAVRR